MDSTVTLAFLQAILPHEGIFCASRRSPTHRGFDNVPCHGLPALADQLLTWDAAGHDVYMALASFRDITRLHPKHGHPYFPRTADNTAAFKALWIDIDVVKREEDPAAQKRGYFSRDAAMQALIGFLTATALPAPMIVSSGGGFHCYWPIGESLSPKHWQAAATRLKSLAIGLDLQIDLTCTDDGARILRPVGTHNRKTGTARPVRMLTAQDSYATESFIQRLVEVSQPFKGAVRLPAAKKILVDDPLFTNAPQHVQDTPQLASIVRDLARVVPVVRGCRQIAEAGMQAEPVWHKMISVIRMCKDGARMIHALSSLDVARYNFRDTQDKIDQAEAAQGSTGMPATCATFNAARPGICSSCPSFNRIKSPIVLGMGAEPQRIVVEAAPTEPVATLQRGEAIDAVDWVTPLPIAPQLNKVIEFDNHMFRLTAQGVVQLTKEKDVNDNDVTKTTLLCSARIYPIATSYETDDSKHVVFTYHFRIEHGSVAHDYLFPGNGMHDVQGTINKLGAYGVLVVHQKHFMSLAHYVRVIADRSKNSLPMVESLPAMGWTPSREFVLGDRFFRANGQQLASCRNPKSAALADQLVVCGSFDAWRAAADIQMRPGNEHFLYCFAQAFAAPLAKFTEAQGFFVHMVGGSGGGKSTTQKLVNSVWGSPRGLMITQTGSKVGATINSTMAHIVRMQNLPVCLDEITNYVAEEVSDFVYVLSGGRDRMRLNSKAESKTAGIWHTTLLTSANTSLREKLSSTKNDLEAELMRFLEVSMPGGDDNENAVDKATFLALDDNYGHAGGQYIAVVAANHDRVALRVRMRVEELVKHFDGTQKERLWFANLACAEVGLELAGWIGLISYTSETRDRLRAFFASLLDESRAVVRAIKKARSSLLGDMLNDLAPETLVVSHARVPDPEDKEAVTAFVLREPKGKLSVRVELSTGNQFVSQAAVRSWCRAHKVAVKSLLDEIRLDGYLVASGTSDGSAVRVQLGRGVAAWGASPAVICLRIKSLKGIAALGGMDAIEAGETV